MRTGSGADIIVDDDVVIKVHRVGTDPDALVPIGVAFAKRSGLVRQGTPDEFEALAGRLAVFRFDPPRT